jgi:hypothetical protein
MSHAPRSLKAGGGVSRILVKTANNRARRKEAMRAFLVYDRDLYIVIAFVPNATFYGCLMTN